MAIYEVTYKLPRCRKVFRVIRFGPRAGEIEGAIVLTVRYVGQYAGEFCEVR